MKKYIYKIFMIIITAGTLVSCVDQLDLQSDGRLTLDDIFSEYNTAANYFNRCRDYIPQVGFSYEATPLASFSDEAHDANDGLGGAVNNWYNDSTSPTYNPLTTSLNPWPYYFEGIRKCNTFLERIDGVPMKEGEKNGWIGEVLTYRAFYYLQLIKRYGGVPLISAPYAVDYDFSQDSRASFEECVDFILADCDAALALPASGSPGIGFRWNITDFERGRVTRGFAYAVKSQAALYAASPLWNTGGSKYTWDKATTITKEALDACLANGYQLFDINPGADVAQDAYAYYFINRSDPSRSVDKETIFETTGARTNVWRWAGMPITDGAEKAGAGPSQELVDAYGMQATGEMPITGYSDADHLNPIINAASGYDIDNPYVGRDPRFYGSIYYNDSPRSLAGSGPIDKDLIPINFRPIINQINPLTADTFETTGSDPWAFTTELGRPIGVGEQRLFTFEYKVNRNVTDGELFFAVRGGPEGGFQTGQILQFDQTTEWKRFEYDLTLAIDQLGFGVADLFGSGVPPENHFLRIDPTGGPAGLIMSIRNMQIEAFTPPPPLQKVETFVGGNSEISDNISQTTNTRTGYYLRKYNNYKSGITVDEDGFMKIFRLGELYLNFAEAAYQSAGPDVSVGGMSALDAVNIIRNRVMMPALPGGLSPTDFEIRYRNERQVELAFEEHRFFDVRRWKILNETDDFVTGMKITKSGIDYTYERIKLKSRGTNADRYLMYPLDQSEVSKMDSYTGDSWQNPGW